MTILLIDHHNAVNVDLPWHTSNSWESNNNHCFWLFSLLIQSISFRPDGSFSQTIIEDRFDLKQRIYANSMMYQAMFDATLSLFCTFHSLNACKTMHGMPCHARKLFTWRNSVNVDFIFHCGGEKLKDFRPVTERIYGCIMRAMFVLIELNSCLFILCCMHFHKWILFLLWTVMVVCRIDLSFHS